MPAGRRWWPWLLVTAGVVAALGLVLALPRLGVLGPPATPAPPPPGQAAAGACPTVPEAYAEARAPQTLRPGAVSLRWCTLPESGAFMSVYAPPDLLTAGVDRWVTAFNALKPIGPDQACTADYSTPMLALLTHADGTTQAVAGMDAGCRVIGGRLGFVEMKRLAIQLITEQRGPAYRPAPAPFTPCAAWSSVIPADVAKVTAGAVCARGDQGLVGTLDPAGIPGLRADIVANLVASGPEPADGPVLQLYQDNGELVSLTRITGTPRWQLVRYGTDRSVAAQYYTWTPSPASEAAVEGIR